MWAAPGIGSDRSGCIGHRRLIGHRPATGRVARRPTGHRDIGRRDTGRVVHRHQASGRVAIGHRRRDTGRVGTPGRRTASDREAADALPLIGHRPPIGRTARRGRRPVRGRREAGALPRVSSLGAARARRMAREVASARTNSGPERDECDERAAVRPASAGSQAIAAGSPVHRIPVGRLARPMRP